METSRREGGHEFVLWPPHLNGLKKNHHYYFATIMGRKVTTFADYSVLLVF